MIQRIAAVLLFAGILSMWSAVALGDSQTPCTRIVSLAPSITEVLFELGLGRNVVGVSRYDRYPAAVRELPQVGGLFDPNYEVVVRLEPSLVVALAEFGEKISYAERLGLSMLVVDHRSVEGILRSISILGERCAVTERAKAVVANLRGAIERITRRAANRELVPTLVVVGGGNEGAILKSVYASGKDGFYDDILRLAGGKNVIRGDTMAVPTVSAEGLLALNPEVIIQVRDAEESRGTSAEEIVTAWQAFPHLRAVQAGRVYVVSDDYVTIPGPRFIQTLEKFADLLAANRASGGTVTP